jgi:hypothetical protein
MIKPNTLSKLRARWIKLKILIYRDQPLSKYLWLWKVRSLERQIMITKSLFTKWIKRQIKIRLSRQAKVSKKTRWAMSFKGIWNLKEWCFGVSNLQPSNPIKSHLTTNPNTAQGNSQISQIESQNFKIHTNSKTDSRMHQTSTVPKDTCNTG